MKIKNLMSYGWFQKIGNAFTNISLPRVKRLPVIYSDESQPVVQAATGGVL